MRTIRDNDNRIRFMLSPSEFLEFIDTIDAVDRIADTTIMEQEGLDNIIVDWPTSQFIAVLDPEQMTP